MRTRIAGEPYHQAQRQFDTILVLIRIVALAGFLTHMAVSASN